MFSVVKCACRRFHVSWDFGSQAVRHFALAGIEIRTASLRYPIAKEHFRVDDERNYT